MKRAAEEAGKTKSGYIRDVVKEKFAEEEAKSSSAWEMGKHLFGKYGSGRSDLATNRKEILSKILEKKFESHH